MLSPTRASHACRVSPPLTATTQTRSVVANGTPSACLQRKQALIDRRQHGLRRQRAQGWVDDQRLRKQLARGLTCPHRSNMAKVKTTQPIANGSDDQTLNRCGKCKAVLPDALAKAVTAACNTCRANGCNCCIGVVNRDGLNKTAVKMRERRCARIHRGAVAKRRAGSDRSNAKRREQFELAGLVVPTGSVIRGCRHVGDHLLFQVVITGGFENHEIVRHLHAKLAGVLA